MYNLKNQRETVIDNDVHVLFEEELVNSLWEKFIFYSDNHRQSRKDLHMQNA
jgi:hypothetical protein